MPPPLPFTFNVQQDARTITVERAFHAPVDPVWAAWTEADLLCQWWAPKPYTCVIRSLELREGGRWSYYMEGPEGDRHYSFFDYTAIRPKTFLAGQDGFCDAAGTILTSMPRSQWAIHFSSVATGAQERIVIHFETATDLERILRMGFQEGFTAGLDQLDALLADQGPSAAPNTPANMNSPARITVSTQVNKPITTVWNAWSNPADIMQWNAASDDWHCPRATNDLRAGGLFSSTMAARDGSFSFDFAGVYDAVEPLRRIAYTLGDGRTCEVLFSATEGGTRVVESFDAETQNSVEMQRDGWQAILDRFKAHVEKKD